MNIKKIEKLKNNKYKIFLDDDFIITYDNVILMYNLLYKKDIDKDLYKKIVSSTKYFDAYNKLVKYIMKKRRSKKESIEYLKKYFNDLSYNDINSIIEKLEDLNIINDSEYCKAYINDKIYLSNQGINKIRIELLSQEIPEDVIDIELKKVDTGLLNSKLEKAILKKINSNKKHSNYHLKQKIMNEMINLGYSKQIVEEIIDSNLKKDNDDILEKEYLKLYNKLVKKYSGQELFMKIKYNLLSKGFESDKVSKLLESKKEGF